MGTVGPHQLTIGLEFEVAVDEVTLRAVFGLGAFAAADRDLRVEPSQVSHRVLHERASIAKMPMQLFVNV